ncbi:hypothetical protein [Candidatus Pelagibacter sp. HIMB1611]|uniref:hypothetical protein n=1 Tax=Candidatus Pelagibacter sp. HIMB1611 TaxID=3413357 RepID=UPI003F825DFA
MSFKDKKRSGDLMGYLIIAVVSVAFIFGGVYFFINEEKKVKIDPKTFCPKENKENYGKTVVLLDLTDALNKAQKEFFLKEIQELKSNLPKHHSLTIYNLDESLDLNTNRKINMCNPGTIEDISTTYQKISINPKEITKRWNEGFSNQITNVINNIIIEEDGQSSSPVMEMFQLIALNEFKGFEGVDNNIIIFSDMIQNTRQMSMYQNGLTPFKEFKKSEYYKKVHTNLESNVAIELLVIQRDGSRNMQRTKQFTNFWVQFFVNGNKAKDFKLTFVDG